MPESLGSLLVAHGDERARAAFREEPVARDANAVRELTAATGFFSDEEVAVAIELVEARLAQGLASGYRFLFADGGGRLDGYVCYGPIALTRSSFDLYWIAVRPGAQRAGLGRRLMEAAEAQARALGATAMYVETSSRPQYEPTRTFYRRIGYRAAAELPDFYAPGDGQVIFTKRLRPDS
ncbi:MAG TPA: GNAT family N-acetyltransferase [Candidatus Acidoferrum sp.]|nr:GNAT family N-acetyltransferase [Candidatus Acidoferrum sp.]